MATRTPGRTAAILALLASDGPLSAPVLSEHIDVPSNTVTRLLTHLRRAKRVYIIRYERGPAAECFRWRAVYALGDRKSATRPKPDRAAVAKRWYDKRKRLKTANSVFNLGLPANEWYRPQGPAA